MSTASAERQLLIEACRCINSSSCMFLRIAKPGVSAEMSTRLGFLAELSGTGRAMFRP